jgi:hypothetical protein
MVFTEYLHEGIAFLLSFVRAMQYPLRLFRYVIEHKGFLIYLNRGITFALNNFEHKQYPSNSLNQNNSIHGV